MKQKIFLFCLSLSMPIFGLLLFSLNVNGYDDKTTHPGLTDEIVDFYNLNFENKISEEEKEWIVQGAIDEDIPPRWINHFYDPINNDGWEAENLGNVSPLTLKVLSRMLLNINASVVASTDWVHNESLQVKYADYGGNNTWENAIRQYADGNEQEAYYILGHILHLLEDKTVPDHTRNDTHAHEGSVLSKDGGSPYEDYCEQFTRSSLDIAQKLKQENAKPIMLSSIDYYLINLANYSNNYFFSEHTINSPKYNNPKIIREDGEYGYGNDKYNNEFKIVKKFELWDSVAKKYNKTYTLIDNNNLVLSSYFSRLSREAVLSGSGVIKLFLDEAGKAKNDKNLIPAEPKISWWKKVRSPLFGGLALFKSTKDSTENAIASFNDQIDNFKNASVSNLNVAAKIIKQSLPKEVFADDGVKNAEMKKINPESIASSSVFIEPSAESKKAESVMPVDPPVLDPVTATSTANQKTIAPAPVIQNKFIPIFSNPYLELETKIMASPREISSSTLADFKFYSSRTFSFEYDLNNTGWQESGEELALSYLPQGENMIEVRAIDDGDVDPTPSVFRWLVDSVSPQIGLAIKPASYVSSTSAVFRIDSDEDAVYECGIDDAGWQACEENFVASGLQEGEHRMEVRTADSAGNIASTSYSWLIDMTAPTSTLSLDQEYYEPDFPVSWSGDDSGSTTPSGVESFNLDYRFENGDWREWLRGSTSTSAVFAGNYDDIIYFRLQAKDRAGNLSDWSEGKHIEIINPIADHIVISQIQIGGNTANDEFVELYNPTDNNMSLAGYKLKRKTAGGQEYNLVSGFGADAIAAKSYYLIAHPSGSISSTTADIVYSSASYSIASDNAVILYDGENIIDKAGFGSASDYESAPFASNPPDGQSMIRRNPATSTPESSMNSSAYDTDNNRNDFLLDAAPIYRNSNYFKTSVSVDNISSAQNSWELSFSWQHTVDKPDSVLLVLAHSDNDIGSVTYGGTEMLLVSENMHYQSFNNIGSYVYILANPPQGSNAVVVNASSQASMNATAISLSNCDTADPIAYVFSEYGAKQHVVNSIGTTTNGIIIDSMTYNHYDPDLTADNGQTVFYGSFRSGQTNNLLSGDSYKAISSQNETMGWSISREMPYAYNMIVIKSKL